MLGIEEVEFAGEGDGDYCCIILTLPLLPAPPILLLLKLLLFAPPLLATTELLFDPTPT